jgi:hypothetical protein
LKILSKLKINYIVPPIPFFRLPFRKSKWKEESCNPATIFLQAADVVGRMPPFDGDIWHAKSHGPVA